MQHRTRDLLMRQRTQLINALRAHLAELGIVAAQGREGIQELLAIIANNEDQRIPIDARWADDPWAALSAANRNRRAIAAGSATPLRWRGAFVEVRY